MSSFIVPLKSGGGLGTAQPDGEEAGEAADWPELVGGRIAASPNTSQMNVSFIFI
jgi:hypothetical protein